MNLVVIGSLILISLSSYSQTKNCKDFKNGKFTIFSENGNSTIERKGSKQIEYGEKSKLKILFTVNWVSDCTYTLILKKVVSNPSGIDFPKDMIVTVEIMETKQNSYVQKSTSNLFSKVLISELFRN